MITKICKNCGKEFKVFPYRKDTSKYCSHHCQHKSLIGKPSWNTGKKTGKPSWNKGLIGYKAGKDNCNYKGGKPKCIDCGKELGSYIAKRCPACNKIWQRGENIYNYKGGFTPNPERTSYAYKAWRLDVFKRDWFTCQYPGCGYKGKDIQAHHIKKAKDNPELLLDVNNGITLCKEHHNKTRCREEKYEELFTAIIKNKS